MKTNADPTRPALPCVRPRWLAGLAALATVAAAPVALALPLHQYRFNDVTTGSGRSSAGGTGGHLVFSSFTATGTLSANSNTPGVFAFGLWAPGGAVNQSNAFTGSPDPTEFFEFTVHPESGYIYSLTALEFSAGRTGTGPRQFVVRSDADSYSANLAVAAAGPLSVAGDNILQFQDNTATNLVAGQAVALAGLGFTRLGTARTFRIYAFNAEGSGQFRLDDLSIHGTVAALPDSPGPVAVLAVLAPLACLRRPKALNCRA